MPSRINFAIAFIMCAGCAVQEQTKTALVRAPAAPPMIASRMPDTTPPGKPHFDSAGAKVGEQLPDLVVYHLDGEEDSLRQTWWPAPTLLLTSSYTCPKSRSTYPGVALMAKRLQDKMHVAIIYVVEAHPKGDPSPYSGVEDVTTENLRDHVLCSQPRTLTERIKLAAQFQKRLEVPDNTIYVDAMDNGVWRSLGGGPNMGFLVDEHGIILARQGWLDAKSMETAAAAILAAIPLEDVAKKNRESDNFMEGYETRRPTEEGSVEKVKAQLARAPELVKRIFPYVPRGRSGDKTLLHYAVDRRHLDVAELLVSAGADVNQQTEHTPTPLHITAKLGDIAITRFLIQHGADVNAKAQGHGPTPLQEALIHRHPLVVDLFRSAGAKPNFFTDVASGNIEAVRERLKEDQSIASRPDGWGRPPLAYAAAGFQYEVVKLLLGAGARDFPHGPYSEDDRSAIWWAVHHKSVGMVRLLCDNGSDPNVLDDAIFDGSVEIARELIADKADPNLEDLHGYRPLHEAAMRDRPEIAELLLAAGAAVSPPTGIDRSPCGPMSSELLTPLHLAAVSGSERTAIALLRHGAKIEALQEGAQTPLHCAASSYWGPAKVIGVVKLLLAAGAKVNAKDADNKTPLDYALKSSRTGKTPDDSVVSLLRQHGATEGGVTPGPIGIRPKQPEQEIIGVK